MCAYSLASECSLVWIFLDLAAQLLCRVVSQNRSPGRFVNLARCEGQRMCGSMNVCLRIVTYCRIYLVIGSKYPPKTHPQLNQIHFNPPPFTFSVSNFLLTTRSRSFINLHSMCAYSLASECSLVRIFSTWQLSFYAVWFHKTGAQGELLIWQGVKGRGYIYIYVYPTAFGKPAALGSFTGLWEVVLAPSGFILGLILESCWCS